MIIFRKKGKVIQWKSNLALNLPQKDMKNYNGIASGLQVRRKKMNLLIRGAPDELSGRIVDFRTIRYPEGYFSLSGY